MSFKERFSWFYVKLVLTWVNPGMEHARFSEIFVRIFCFSYLLQVSTPFCSMIHVILNPIHPPLCFYIIPIRLDNFHVTSSHHDFELPLPKGSGFEG
jgi:hypothetical protein